MSSIETLSNSSHTLARSGLWGLVRRALAHRLASLDSGAITVVFPNGEAIRHHGNVPGRSADLVLHRWRALWWVWREGDIGLAQAYIDGDCDTSDLKALLALGAANSNALQRVVSSSRLAILRDRLRHWTNSNTRRGSRRNIATHYDLGNAFYELWLDRTMNYSSALYTADDQSLEQAQYEKLQRIAELLDVQKGQRVLEIGCGWGALAEYLIEKHGCPVTGLTLSAEQLTYARARVSPAKDLADFRLVDYRDVAGCYDRIASIEMMEAVGERYWPAYFRKISDSLTDDGIAVLQVITIDERLFEEYRHRPDFIQRFIFPGGMLPTIEIIKQEARKAGLTLEWHEDFGSSYARTLKEWHDRFLGAWSQIEALGFDTRFRRMWEYYLSYCEVGFDVGLISVGLFRFRWASTCIGAG